MNEVLISSTGDEQLLARSSGPGSDYIHGPRRRTEAECGSAGPAPALFSPLHNYGDESEAVKDSVCAMDTWPAPGDSRGGCGDAFDPGSHEAFPRSIKCACLQVRLQSAALGEGFIASIGRAPVMGAAGELPLPPRVGGVNGRDE